jgi:hypothetical protein
MRLSAQTILKTDSAVTKRGTPPDAALDADSETRPALIAAASGGCFWRRGVPMFYAPPPLPDRLVDQVDVVFLVNA